MKTVELFEWMQDHTRAVKIAAIPFLFVMMICIYGLVYFTGGIKYVFSHSMYIPVILAGLIFGKRGGVVAGALGGYVLGPFMPIDVITGEPQDTANWIFRACIFALIGLLIGAASDSTQKYLERIKWIMKHDVLSGLPNRLALIDAMNNFDKTQSVDENRGLAIVSIDNGEEVESAYGPELVDRMIKQLADRFDTVLSNHNALYRTNTHQLGILLAAKQNGDNAALLDKLTEISKQPFHLGDISLHGDVRIGYAELSNLEDDPENYLRKAEIALRTASEKSQSWVFFTPELEQETTRNNLRLLSELKEALECGQLSLHYQPKISIKTGVMHGVEALMRWHHPKLGLIPPGNFIPRAEKSVLIDSLTEWAIDTALAQQVKWKNQGVEVPVAVNISPRNLLQPGFVDTVMRLLERHQVKGKFLELEVTEGALMLDIEHTIVKLMELSDVNVIISIDDFGTGYSSLRYLNSLPATTIKVDQSFIRSLLHNTGSKHIVEAAVNLAHGLQMSVVAEGVEDAGSFQCLANLGCDVAQGYYISRPIPGADLLSWHRNHLASFVAA